MSDTTESDYYAFMGFDPDNARKVLSFYTQFFTAGPVLELACGPGVFLSLLRDEGIEAVGVDLDEGMAKVARKAGFDVTLDDALTHLQSLSDASLHGLFAAHFLEHLPSDAVQSLYHEARRVLKPAGVFVAVVPNAACLSVIGHDFWRDPTHVRFYDPMALHFFAAQAGMTVTVSGGNPRNHPGAPPHVHMPASSIQESLKGNLAEFVQRADTVLARGEAPRLRPAAAAAEQDRLWAAQSPLWAELAHIASSLDDRVQVLQHELSTMRTAYEQLLGQLYPSNEVFVVAQPSQSAAPTDPSKDERPLIEGTV